MSQLQAVVALRSYNGDHATGLIASSDVVLVPTPPAWLLKPEVAFAAYLMPLPPDGRPVEELTPRRMATLGVKDSGPVLTYVEVTEEIGYPPVQVRESARARATIGASLETSDGDYWEALESIGAIPPGLRDTAALSYDSPFDGVSVTNRRDIVFDSHSVLAQSCCSVSRPECCPRRALFGY